MDSPVSAGTIKFVKSLGQKKFRDLRGVFVVEGEKMVEEALASSFEVTMRFTAGEVGRNTMERLSLLSSPSPALAVVRKPEGISIDDVSTADLPAKGLFLALDGIRDPGNLGTILRIADWFGVDGVFASPDTVDIFNPKVVQATMGAIFRVRFHYCGIKALCRRFSALGGKVYGTFLDGNVMYSESLEDGSRAPAVIVVGNESNGISPEVAEEVDGRLFIPPYPEGRKGSESLNAAVATAITVAEFRRRSALANKP